VSAGEGRGGGQEGRNDPNNVCTYEYMNKEKNHHSLQIFIVTFQSYDNYYYDKNLL
jgi:hypothetical protein